MAILGAGSMGLLHALVLRAWQPEAQIEILEPDGERRRLAEELVATSNGITVSPPGSPRGELFDVVFDTVGGESPIEWAATHARRGGTIVLFAHAEAGSAPRVDLNRLFHREINVVSTYSGSLADQDAVWELLCDRRLEPGVLVTHQLPLQHFSKAVQLARERRALKVLFTFDSTERVSRIALAGTEGELS